MCSFIVLPVFLAVITTNSLVAGDGLGKCCEFGEVLKEFENSTFTCIEDKTKRNSVFVAETNVIRATPQGSCLEYSDDFFEFEFSEEKIIKKILYNETIYPKCCPIGYIYNSSKHSCQPKNSFQHNFIHVNLVQVGLPRCHVLLDTPLNSIDNLPTPEEEFCEDETSTGYVRRTCKKDTSICNDIRCVKKCCPDGQSFLNGPYCVATYTHGLDLNFSKKIEDPSDPFAIVFNNTKCDGTFFLLSEARFNFNLLKNGDFQLWNNLSNSFLMEYPVNDEKGYCIEYSNRSTAKGFYFFKCLSYSKVMKFEYAKYPKILSCIFLILTIVIYLLLSQARKLFGKILINYCISTFFMFAILVYTQIRAPNGLQCEIVGFAIILVSTVSFAFLNVMCCDIWLTFGSTKHSVGVYQRRKDIKKLLIYMSYAWGMPLLLTVLIYVLSISKSLSPSIRPFVGVTACFIEARSGNYAQIVFLRIPHLIMQIINIFLFVKTILYCIRIKNEIQRINDNKNEKKLKFNRDKEKLFLILKLAVVMGISFTFDTLTAFVDFSTLGKGWAMVEIVIDCINCLQGVFIFIIFICKKSIYNDFLKTLHIRRRDTYINNTIDSYTSASRISLKNGTNSTRN